MKVNLTLEVDSPEEEQLLEELAEVRNRAIANGMSEQEVARVLNIVAQGVLSPSFEEQGVQSVEEEKTLCPSCGSVLESVEFPGIGETPTIVPCGCEVEYDDLPQDVLDDISNQ
jgi:hypothetical protein